MQHDTMGRVATLQLNRLIQNEFPISRPFPFSRILNSCIYVSIPRVRSGNDSENDGSRAEGKSSKYLEFEAGPGSFGAKPDRLTQLGFITGSAASLAANICNT